MSLVASKLPGSYSLPCRVQANIPPGLNCTLSPLSLFLLSLSQGMNYMSLNWNLVPQLWSSFTQRMEYSDLTERISFWNRLQDHCSRRIQLMKFNQRLTPQSTRSRHLYNENRLCCNSCNSEKWKSRAGCYFWNGFADHMKLINIMNVKGIFIWALSFRMLSLHKLIIICNCNFVKKIP